MAKRRKAARRAAARARTRAIARAKTKAAKTRGRNRRTRAAKEVAARATRKAPRDLDEGPVVDEAEELLECLANEETPEIGKKQRGERQPAASCPFEIFQPRVVSAIETIELAHAL